MLVRIVLVIIVFASIRPAFAQSYAVEGLPLGSLSGVDGWSGSSAATVDGSLFSPLDGSTQSIRFRGNGGFISVSRAIGTTIASGVYQISYDLFITPRVSSNQIMRVEIKQADNTEIFVPYAQNGGPGTAQNAKLDKDGLGGAAYGGNDFVNGASVYQPNRWYRLGFMLDFDLAQIRDAKIFDISSGTQQLVAATSGPFFFNNNGTSYFKSWNRLGLVLDPATTAEGWNFDNFRVTAVPELAGWSLLILGGISGLALLRHRHTMFDTGRN